MASILSISWRAAAALRRHGLAQIIHFTRVSIAERGAAGYFRFAMARLGQSRNSAEANAARAHGGTVEVTMATLPTVSAPPAVGPDVFTLDPQYSWDELKWNAFMGPVFIRRLHERLRPSHKAPASVLIVIDARDTDQRINFAAVEAFRDAGEFNSEVLILNPGSKAGALKDAIKAASPDTLVLFLKAGDHVRPEMAPALKLFVDDRVEVFSFDTSFRDDGRIYPLFQPGANPIHAEAVDYLFSRFGIRAGVAASLLGGKNLEPYDLLKRWIAARPPSRIRSAWTHASLPLALIDMDLERVLAMRRVLLETPPRALPPGRKVSVVICTKDKGHLMRQLVRSLFQTAGDHIEDVVVVSNNTTNFFARQTLADLATDPRVRILQHNEPFNFSRQSNLGADASTAPFILFLNDDITPISDCWLDEMLRQFERPDVGAVGPLLVYPDERVQHAGMFLGYNNVAGHGLRFATLPDQDYIFYASAPRETSCLTGAALLMSRECYEALNGFDELLASYLQDVDICLRARNVGYRSVFTPKAKLIHMESVSVQSTLSSHLVNENRGREHALFFRKWGRALKNDPFHNANFDVNSEQLRACAPA
jgi:GT2 family glycosyltransferase